MESVEEAAAPRGADRLPADDQGDGRRRRARHPARRLPRGARRPRSPAPRPRRFRPLATRPCCWSSVIAPVRHVEVQIVADGQGGAWAVGLRDCSYQRRNQKVIEESASPGAVGRAGAGDHGGRAPARPARRLPGRVHRRVPVRARRAALLLPRGQRATAGRASGHRGGHRARPGQAPAPRRRRRAPARGSRRRPSGTRSRRGSTPRTRRWASQPAPGRIVMLRLPTGPGVRVDTGVAEGDVIPPQFDSMIAKLIAWGADREEALARLHCALAETMVVVDGGTTNQGFLLEILDRPEVRTGEVDTGWLDRLNLSGEIVPVRHADVALVQAAVELAEAETAADRARFYAFARRGRPQSGADLERIVELRHRGQSYELAVAQVAPARYRVKVDGETIDSRVQRLGHARAATRAARARLPHADLDAGRRRARRGRRRPAPHLPRRRRARPQPRAGRRRLDPGAARRRGRGRRRRRRGRGDEDGELAGRAVPRPRARGAGGRERPRGGPGAARRARAARGRDGRRRGRAGPLRARRSRRRRRWRPSAAARTCDGCSGSCWATT